MYTVKIIKCLNIDLEKNSLYLLVYTLSIFEVSVFFAFNDITKVGLPLPAANNVD